MEINHKVLEKLSQLAALKIDKPQEQEDLKDYLTKTLSYFEQIKTIDTKKVPPLISPFQNSLRVRKDQVIDFSDKEKLLEPAPQKQGNLVKVPATL